jgi:tRNA(Ile)-lysidine synthase
MLEQRFQEQCASLEIDPSTPYLIAVSGGIDSMVLLHLCRAVGLNVRVAHANFQLRGLDSDQDAALVEDAAQKAGYAFHGKAFSTAQVAQEQGISIQMAARALRYAWFGNLCKKYQAAGLLTGHHLQDSVETFFIHFLRGAGWQGLSGIPAKSYLADWDLQVWRPLLVFTRGEITQYATENGILWREDSSNAKTEYERNKIRHEVLPVLEAMKSGFWETSRSNLEHLRSSSSNYRYLLEKQLLSVGTPPGSWEIRQDRLQAMPHPTDALWELLHPLGFHAEQVRQITSLLDTPGKSFFSEAGARVVIDRARIVVHLTSKHHQETEQIVQVEENDLMVRLPAGGRLFLTEWEMEAGYPTDVHSVVVDCSELRYPLQVRNWKPGDRFQPLGMEGKHKKLQDFFTDQKLSLLEKEQAQVLVNGDQQVIWVIGYRLDHRFRVKSTSKDVKKISWLK